VLEHLNRIEGEVFDAYDQLVGDRQIAFDLSHTVNSEQLLGIELTRADKTRLAELLATLAAIGKARQLEDRRYVAA
jgi:hypothetical protein